VATPTRPAFGWPPSPQGGGIRKSSRDHHLFCMRLGMPKTGVTLSHQRLENIRANCPPIIDVATENAFAARAAGSSAAASIAGTIAG
jgi:hypothetical protein